MAENPELLAVVEVPRESRVQCSSPGCGHSVYKRVHILRIDGAVRIFGATCFAREFADRPMGSSGASFTGHISRPLTAEERRLLRENTEQLIARFAIAHVPNGLAQRNSAPHKATPLRRPGSGFVAAVGKSEFSAEERAAVEPQALALLEAKLPGLNFYSAGFNGLLQSEIDRILRSKAPAF